MIQLRFGQLRARATPALATLAAIFAITLSAYGDLVPDALRYQGTMTDQSGIPLDGERIVDFALYRDTRGGEPLWTEGMNVDFRDGVFTVTLGQTQPFPVGVFEAPVWLGVRLDRGEEYAKRLPLTATAFVLNADDAPSSSTTARDPNKHDERPGANDKPAHGEDTGQLAVNDQLRHLDAAPGKNPLDPRPPGKPGDARACPLGCASALDAHAGQANAHHTLLWADLGGSRIHTTRNRVGINTDSVDVEGTLHVRDSGTTAPVLFLEGGNSAEGDLTWKFGENLNVGSWNAATDDFTEALRISSGGRVSLFNDLTFSSETGDRLSLFGNRIGAANMYGFGVGSGTLYAKANGRHAWYVGENFDSSPEMALTSTGLGIGTNSPNHELVVQANNPAFQIRDDVSNNSANAARIELLERAGGSFNGGAFLHWNGESNRLFLGTKQSGVNTNVLVINRSGSNVGIGTQNPGNYRLAVNGAIRAKEIVVESGWADFVFADDYRLRSLSEVETHIDTHGHLPEIPSAATVAKEGVRVGEMESKLLQKIEELTLYMIDVNKRVAELENENVVLRAASEKGDAS